MHRQTRRFIFYFFLTAFLIAAPLVVLYTAGYRYSWSAGRIIQTGLLSVGSVPKNATVIIDGRTYRAKTPAVIDDLYPGNHAVTLEKNGYIVWQKTLAVRSQETTFIDRAALYLAAEPQLAAAGTLERIYPSNRGNSFAYVKAKEGWREVWLYDPLAASEILLARLPFTSGQTISPAWSADDSYISLWVKGTKSQTLTVYHLPTLVSTKIALPDPASQFWWDTQRGDTLFVQNRGRVSYLRLPQTQPILTPIENATVRTSGNDLIAAQTVNDGVVLARWQGETTSILAYLPQSNYRFHPCPFPDLILLEDEKRERLLLIDPKNPAQPILLNAMAALWRFEPDGDRLLYSDYFDLHLFDLSTLSDLTLTRLSRPLTSLAWQPGASAILYMQSDNLTSVDLDYRGGHITTELAKGQDLSGLFLDPRGKTAYFSGTLADVPGLYIRALQK